METETSEKSPRMQLLEYQFGKPIDQILIDLYAELGRHDEVAERLGISRQSLDDWRRRLGLRIERRFRYAVTR